MNAATAAKLLAIAAGELGYTESPAGSNKTKFAAEIAPVTQGQAWCAVFVSWVFQHAGVPLPMVQPDAVPGGGFAYCPFAVNYAHAHGQTVGQGYVMPGDIVLFDWEHTGWEADHVGIVESVALDGHLITIEGNTAIGNDSNGGEVMRRDRYWPDITCVWRPPVPDLAPQEPEEMPTYTKIPLWVTVRDNPLGTSYYRLTHSPMAGWLLQGWGACRLPGVQPDASGLSTIALGADNPDLDGLDMSPAGDFVVVMRTDGRTLEFPTGEHNPEPAAPTTVTLPPGLSGAQVAAALEQAAQALRAA